MFWSPCIPSGAVAAHNLQRDAVHRTRRNAQFAAGAPRLNDGVHAFAGADDGVGGARFDAQGAADAPVFVNHGHGQWAINAVVGVQWLNRLSREG